MHFLAGASYVASSPRSPAHSQTLVLIYIYNTELSIIFSLQKSVIFSLQKKRPGTRMVCSSVGQIPRGWQQVKNLGKSARKKEPKKTLSTNIVQEDPWFRLLGESKKQASNSKTAFLRDVRIAP